VKEQRAKSNEEWAMSNESESGLEGLMGRMGELRGFLMDGTPGVGFEGWLERIEGVLTRTLAGALVESPREDFVKGVFAGSAGVVQAGALLRPCEEFLRRGGKRWRPLLSCLVCEGLGGGDAVLPLTPLVELCHNASLIHDDIEDGSALRRGKPVLHILYGVDAALNSGCFLYFLPLVCIDVLEAAPEFKLKLYSLWALTMRRLHLGQSMDIKWHKRSNFTPTTGDYYAMCSLKTGALARFAAELGALSCSLAGVTAAGDVVEGLAFWAERLGVGFQILDDVRNLSSGVPGKERGDDVVEGKFSLPVLLFLRGGAKRREFVQRCFDAAHDDGVGAPEVGELIGALQEAGVLEEAEREAHTLLSGWGPWEAKASIRGRCGD
jgi:octaprenyl-diphosphate synthase